jgi:hypothetical protein
VNLFGEVTTPPEHLPITVTDAETSLARAVVEECERLYLQRAIVHQERRIVIDGELPSRLEFEPTTAITSLTRWTPTDDAAVVDADTYTVMSRDPLGTLIEPAGGMNWPAPERAIGSFTVSYSCGWEVTPETAPGAGDAVNAVPPSVLLMLERAIEFRSGAGLADLRIGSLDLSVAASYKTDALPQEITNIARGFFYRPGLIIGRP